jgi:hypothetical protein
MRWKKRQHGYFTGLKPYPTWDQSTFFAHANKLDSALLDDVLESG